jgi:hypothetical protein
MARAEKPSPTIEAPVRRNRTAAVGLDAAEIGRKAFARAGFVDCGLVLRWREIVGAEVARIARPLKLVDGPTGGTLTLKADPAAALFLQHESRALCARVNAWLGRPAVQRLRFVPGEIAPNAPRRERPRLPEAGASDPSRRFDGNEPLKSALLRLARARNTSTHHGRP